MLSIQEAKRFSLWKAVHQRFLLHTEHMFVDFEARTESRSYLLLFLVYMQFLRIIVLKTKVVNYNKYDLENSLKTIDIYIKKQYYIYEIL